MQLHWLPGSLMLSTCIHTCNRHPSCAPVAIVAVPDDQVKFNVIPNNGQWENGVPPVMGAHLMASGTVAPMSTSSGTVNCSSSSRLSAASQATVARQSCG
jgi:hypothetical protein